MGQHRVSSSEPSQLGKLALGRQRAVGLLLQGHAVSDRLTELNYCPTEIYAV